MSIHATPFTVGGKREDETRILIVAALLGCCPALNADVLMNGGFETNVLSPWALNNTSGGVVNTGNPFYGHTGIKMGQIYTTGLNAYTTLSQVVDMNLGDQLEGWLRTYSYDSTAGRDDAYVRAILGSIVNPIWSGTNFASIFYGVFPGDSGWLKWSWTAPAAGQYTLQFGIENRVNNQGSTALYIDDVKQIKAPVAPVTAPEPASLILLATVAGFAFVQRRRFTTR